MRGHVLHAVLATVLLTGCAGAPVEKTHDKRMLAARANTDLGIEYLREGKHDLSRQYLEKALELEPDYADAHSVIALLFEQVGELDKAETHYRRSLRIRPDDAAVHNNYGQYLCNRKRFADAEEQFNTAAGLPFYATPWLPLLNAGICMATRPDLKTAERYYRAALEKSPEYAPALLKMAELNFAQDNHLGTRAYLQRYHQTGNRTAQSLWLGVQTEFALGDHQAWGNLALQLRNRFPDSPQAALLAEWENERRAGH